MGYQDHLTDAKAAGISEHLLTANCRTYRVWIGLSYRLSKGDSRIPASWAKYANFIRDVGEAPGQKYTLKRNNSEFYSSTSVWSPIEIPKPKKLPKTDRKNGKFLSTYGLTSSNLKKIHKTEYAIWYGMWHRCLKGAYVGLNRTPEDNWKNFDTFLADMGSRPSKEHSIERKDNTKGYSADNCEWLLKAKQQLNRPNSINIQYEGKKTTIKELADTLNLPKHRVYTQIKAGKSAETIDKQTLNEKRSVTIDGITKTIKAWAKYYNANYNAVMYRHRKGYDLNYILNRLKNQAKWTVHAK